MISPVRLLLIVVADAIAAFNVGYTEGRLAEIRWVNGVLGIH